VPCGGSSASSRPRWSSAGAAQDGSIIDFQTANEGSVIATIPPDAYLVSVSGFTPGTPA
jgi:hypothetical protein